MPNPAGARRWTAVAIIAATALAAAGCGRDYQAATSDPSAPPIAIETSNAGPYHGVELEQPIAKPDVTLQDTTGTAFNLARDTSGEVVLLYAGYTHCPDVCPTTVADLAAALRGLAPQDRDRVKVVMYSTDPGRDTPERMRAFLDQFDPSFIGVLGEESALIGAINAMGIDVQPPTVADNGDILVEHGAQVLAFAPPSDEAGLLWTSGTTVTEYREDIQRLLAATQSAS
jgi:protein SCO1/2